MDVSILFVCSAVMTLVWADSIHDESKLQADLLTGYNLNVRPSGQVYIACSLTIRNLLSLDTVRQTLAVKGAMAVIWEDRRLSWNESENGNVRSVLFKVDQIWRPTLVLQNSAVGIEVIGDNGNQRSIPLTVSFVGSVFWLAPAFFISSCSVDVSQFPFDTQTCELVISGWLYTESSVKLVHLDDSIDLGQFEENGEFEVMRTYTRVDRYKSYMSYVETLVFGIEIRRKYSYYLVNIVLPVLFMQLLGLVVFVVPTDSGEKLTFSLTLLLSLTVMMTLVSEKIPTTSLQIPTLSIYMLGGAVISSLEVILVVVILYFQHYHKECVHLSRRTQLILFALGFLTCKKSDKIQSEKVEPVMNSKKHNGIIIVEDLASDIQVTEEKVYIPADENEQLKENGFVCASKEISVIMNKFSLVFCTSITLIFTFAMLVMVL